MHGGTAEGSDSAAAPEALVRPRIVEGGALRALRNERVFVDLTDGMISGASLWLSRRPPRATRGFLRTYDICVPWAEVAAGPSAAVDACTSVMDHLGTPSSQGGQSSPGSSISPARPGSAKGRIEPLQAAGVVEHPGQDVSPEQVLRRISGLMAEMSAMETSLTNLREELDQEADELTSEGETTRGPGRAARDARLASARSSLEGSCAHPAPARLAASRAGSARTPRQATTFGGALPRRASRRLRKRLPEPLRWLEAVGVGRSYAAAGRSHLSPSSSVRSGSRFDQTTSARAASTGAARATARAPTAHRPNASVHAGAGAGARFRVAERGQAQGGQGGSCAETARQVAIAEAQAAARRRAAAA